MDLAKSAHIAQILSVFPGAYCAYAAWVSLHPPPPSAPLPAIGGSVIAHTVPAGFFLALGAFVTLIAFGVILGLLARFSPPKLTIKSAVYGTGSVNDIDVRKILHRHKRDGLAVLVTNDLFGRDPAPNQPKRLQVEYTYGNYSISVVSRPEHSRLVLPEDSWTQSQLAERTKRAIENYNLYLEEVQKVKTLRESVRDVTTARDQALRDRKEALNEVEHLKAQIAQAPSSTPGDPIEDQFNVINKMVSSGRKIEAPQLLVEHKPQGEKEYLVFINDGQVTLKGITLGPLLWGTAYRREINLHNVLGPLRAKQEVDSKFAVFEQIGTSQSMSKLPAMLREIAQKGCEAEPEVTVTYQDMEGRAFSRRFVLAIDPFNRVVWDPGPIRHDAAKAAL